MRFTTSLVMAASALLCLMSSPAAAQATRTWVSGVGDDANPCSRTAPCKTFAGAISKTAANGEISVLDPGGFGPVTITKSISIVADGSEGSILSAGTSAVIVNAGPTDIVHLRGLMLEGAGTGVNGVRFLAGGALQIEDCVIRNVRGGTAGNSWGVLFTPSGAAELYITDTMITDNGAPGGIGGGVMVQPAAGGTARALLNRVSVLNSTAGVTVDGTQSTLGIFVTLRDSVSAGHSGNGVTATSATGKAPVAVTIENSGLLNNSGTALAATGQGVSVFLAGSTVVDNAVGLAFSPPQTQIFSFKNNNIAANGSSATPNPINQQ